MITYVRRTLAALNCPAPTDLRFGPLVKPPLQRKLDRLLRLPPRSPRISRTVRVCHSHFTAMNLFRGRICPSVPGKLTTLTARRHLFITASGPHVFTRQVVRRFNLSTCFYTICNDRLSNHLTRGNSLVTRVLSRTKLQPRRAIVINSHRRSITNTLRGRIFPIKIL